MLTKNQRRIIRKRRFRSIKSAFVLMLLIHGLFLLTPITRADVLKFSKSLVNTEKKETIANYFEKHKVKTSHRAAINKELIRLHKRLLNEDMPAGYLHAEDDVQVPSLDSLYVDVKL